MSTGIQKNPEWYPGLTTSSSFEEVQQFLYLSESNTNCAKPCEPLCTSRQLCSAMGVNVFGYDGFRDAAAVATAVGNLFAQGVRNFRVINVGGWANTALEAIDLAAAGSQEPTSVQITSLFFDSPATCDSLPSWMDFSMSVALEKLAKLTHVSRILVQIDTCSICQSSPLYCINPTEQGFGQVQESSQAKVFADFIQNEYFDRIKEAHAAFPINVEFVIPFQNEQSSPLSMLTALQAQLAPLQAAGRRFHLEGTVYPFWTPGSLWAPFDSAVTKGFMDFAQDLGFDGFVVAETGWPQKCSASNTRPPNLENMCRYWRSTLREVEALAAKGRLLSYHWKMGPANDGSCGEQTWGLFEPDGSAVCEDIWDI
ncbi:asl1 [Symbiodinium sp. CCMP2456]|nr:asl1 [Symbiodinium sp. CCMP2456]